ncbi:DinB family protein [Nonomuraea sp. FMUSA5-5]|uniref:DinB family protein n=1 Tax=Nonomuraea composti TaxID=2720023 RepID=A0ABX1BE40_9ACTN|nr:DinB family protein [Nonomuraea sp. FMUSA5-5]NJP94009.1 DinB family protein [Nonomuraea sp. FMUSA5-5]
MPDIDEQGRPEPPLAEGELATLVGYLEYHRATLAWKTAGLDAAGLKATVGVSSMTLGGMLKHLAYVEDFWFARFLHDREGQPLWGTVDWKADPDWDWHSATANTPEELRELWQDAVSRSRALLDEALADGGLDRLSTRAWGDGRKVNVRWILVHMIEEYARHNGHADLIRESVDGLTGE